MDDKLDKIPICHYCAGIGSCERKKEVVKAIYKLLNERERKARLQGKREMLVELHEPTPTKTEIIETEWVSFLKYAKNYILRDLQEEDFWIWYIEHKLESEKE